MPYDEAELDATILDLQNRIQVINTERAELNEFLESLQTIEDEDFIDESGDTQQRKKEDQGTRKQLTDTRRDDIYDDVVPVSKLRMAQRV